MSPRMLILLLTLICADKGCCENNCSFQNLLQSLQLSNASKVRPVRDWRNASIVYLDLTLYTLVDLDMSKQTAIIFVWFYMSWRDEFISWNPNDFCGIKRLFVNNDYFWKPDLYIFEIYNMTWMDENLRRQHTVVPKSLLTLGKTMISWPFSGNMNDKTTPFFHSWTENDDKSPQIPYYILYSNGKVTNAMPIRIVSTCNLDIFKFPFDNQTCRLSFGSYVYTVSDMVMWPKSNSSVVNQNALDVFATKNDWKLQAVTVHNTTFKNEGNEYSHVIYSIYVKRASVIYVLNLIIPACFLVFLDIASMFIRSYGDRLDFKITVVLGFSVLLLILNDMLPNSDNTPMLGIFCCICMAMMVLSIIGTVATSYMTEQSTTNPEVPAWVKILVLKHLARIMLFRRNSDKKKLVTPVKIDNDPENAKKSENNEYEEVPDNKRAVEKDANSKKEIKLLKRILLEILKIHQDLALDMQQKAAGTEWETVAQIVDRLVLILYLVIVTLVFIIMVCVWSI